MKLFFLILFLVLIAAAISEIRINNTGTQIIVSTYTPAEHNATCIYKIPATIDNVRLFYSIVDRIAGWNV